MSQKHIDEISESYRQGDLEYLVGAGVSIDAGLPNWNALNRNLLRVFFQKLVQDEASDDSPFPIAPEPDELDAFAEIFTDRFGREPVVDLVRQFVSEEEFKLLVRRALYGQVGDYEPQFLQFELAAALSDTRGENPARILTTNFDNLLERAYLRLNDIDFTDIDEHTNIVTDNHHSDEMSRPDQRPKFLHLHGYLPPDDSAPEDNQLILSEQDFWNTGDNWATDKLNEILLEKEDRDLLIVGMSLADPRLRRCLFERASETDPPGDVYVLLDRNNPGTGASLEKRRAHKLLDAFEKRYYWRDLGVKIVPVEDLKLLPLLLRQIRLGNQPTKWFDLGREFLGNQASSIEIEELHSEERQEEITEYLCEQVEFLRPRFEVPLEESLSFGFFVPDLTEEATIRLAFRYREPRLRTASSAPDSSSTKREKFQGVPKEHGDRRTLDVSSVENAEGAAGYAFVTGTVVQARHDSEEINRNFTSEMKSEWDSGRTFSSLLSVPIYGSKEWVPLGVGFLSSTAKKPFWDRLSSDEYLKLEALVRASYRELLGYE